MNTLICPISFERLNKNTVRLTGFFTALTVALYALTGNITLLILLLADFTIRGFTTLKISPLAYLSKHLVSYLNLGYVGTDKAPKLFAARVGFLFSLASVITYFINPLTSVIIALTLMSFALLESVFNFCVGCVVYTYIVLPLNKTKE